MKSRICLRVAMALMVLSLATPLLSACSKNSSDTQVDLDSYQWAIFTSTYRNTGILPSPSSGYAIFVRDDGSYDLVSHSGMDPGRNRVFIMLILTVSTGLRNRELPQLRATGLT